ncbi:Flp pilus assembly protein TadG [Variovorax sp. W1I1]|uniref:TadE/TadG family type IV pilus assembly protein n=1 Tax=Variovorax sp. W1I1 TaxID=3042309 RepID=UPI002789D973|nr:TadE/TadG family type IV pilus assembly protein [Variovorax sp. W1I1]MDQ0606125.1 Flp pilus assembly protein TadG [Variovorax sp. W1I1]
MNRASLHRSPNRFQRGVYAIEFAFVFLIFFAVLYGIISYGVLLTFRMGLQNAAEDGARAALRYKPTSPERASVAVQVATQRSLWMPAAVKPLDVTAQCSVAGGVAGPCSTDTCASNASWDQRCRIIVTVKAQGMELVLPPMFSMVLPSQIAGQASMLLDGGNS